MTPSAFYQFAAALRTRDDVELAPSLRALILAGEAWTSSRRAAGTPTAAPPVSRGRSSTTCNGPTETTVYVTRRELTPEFVAVTHASDIGYAIEACAPRSSTAGCARFPTVCQATFTSLAIRSRAGTPACSTDRYQVRRGSVRSRWRPDVLHW